MSVPPTPPVKSLRILVVEDDLSALEMIYEVLLSLGVEASPASDSERALAVAQNEKFDGIFLDLQMPRIDGFKVMKAIRSSGWNQRTPIIVLTGMGDRDTMERAFAAGATFFLRKPVDRRQLTVLLNSTRGTMLVNRRRFRRIPLVLEITVDYGLGAEKIHSLDVSEGGMLVDGLKLDPGKRVRVSFRLTSTASLISTSASVKHVDALGTTGLLFQELKPEQQHILRQFIDTYEASHPAEQLPGRAS